MTNRPVCPKCGKLFAVIDSRADGDLRVQRFGCRECGINSGGARVLAAEMPRTRIIRTLTDSVKKS